MSSRLGRPVPWCSWAEWEMVRIGLTSDDPTAALEKVSVWRCRGRIPLSVDSYANFLEIQRRDSGSGNLEAQHPMSAELEMQLRLQYAMTVVRLVNGISDSSQKGKVATSVAVLATKSGMPRLLVDVRHEAAHNELPSLSLLRLASQQALHWLLHYYWERQAQSLQDTQSHITSLIKELVDERMATLGKGFQNRSHADSEEEAGEAKAVLRPDALVTEGRELRHKKQIISELKELIHPSCLGLAVDSILDHGSVPPPQMGGKTRTLEEAVRESALDLITTGLPDLRSGILVGATSRLTQAPQTTASPASEASEGEASGGMIWLEWVRLLLGSAPKKYKEEADDGQEWKPCTSQVKVLLAMSMQAPAAQLGGGFECGTGVKSELQTLLSAFLRRRAALPKRSFNSSAAGGMLSRDFSPTHAAGAERVVGGEPAGAACGLGVMQSQAQVEMDSQLLFLQEAARAKRLKLSKELTNEIGWQKAEGWKTCALGNLPSVHQDNGEPSNFEGHHLRLLSVATDCTVWDVPAA